MEDEKNGNKALDKSNEDLDNNSNSDKSTNYINSKKPMFYNDPLNTGKDDYKWRIGFWKRLLAYIIDMFIYGIIFLIIITVFTNFGEKIEVLLNLDLTLILTSIEMMREFNNIMLNSIIPLSLVIGIIYYSTEIFFAATPGKMILGIVIGSANKKSARLQQLISRFLIKNISSLFALLFILTKFVLFDILSSMLSAVIFFGCFLVLTERRQSLYDMIVKTAVYYKDELKQFDKL